MPQRSYQSSVVSSSSTISGPSISTNTRPAGSSGGSRTSKDLDDTDERVRCQQIDQESVADVSECRSLLPSLPSASLPPSLSPLALSFSPSCPSRPGSSSSSSSLCSSSSSCLSSSSSSSSLSAHSRSFTPSTCSGRSSPETSTNSYYTNSFPDFERGSVAFLPSSSTGTVQTLLHNPGAFGHPVLITRVYGNQVQFSVCTSFGSTQITSKLSNSSLRAEYRQIQHSNADGNTISHDGLTVLPREIGPDYGTFRKLTYAKVSERHWIDRRFLERFKADGGGKVRLTFAAVEALDETWLAFEQKRQDNFQHQRIEWIAEASPAAAMAGETEVWGWAEQGGVWGGY